MNFLQRAVSSVTRRKGKSIILFLVIFVLGNVIAGAIAIQQSTTNVEKDVKAKLGANATISFDYTTFQKDNEETPVEEQIFPDEPDLKAYQQIGALPYVKYFDYNSLSSFVSSKLERFAFEQDEGGMMSGYGGSPRFNLKGVNYPKLMDIEQKKIKLAGGKVFSDEDVKEGKNVVIIGKRLAEQNNISLGADWVIKVESDNVEYDDNGNEIEVKPEDIKSFDFPVKVIGFFEPVTTEKEPKKNTDAYYNQMSQSEELENTIYLPNELVKEFNKQTAKEIYEASEEDFENYEYFSPAYTLKSPEDTEAFKEEAEPLLPDYYIVQASADQYDQVGGSMKKMNQISKYVVIIAVLAALLIIGLVVLLFMRDRKHELGIYLSIGETRGKVMGQIMVELLIISALALVCSLVTGNLLGNVVSNSLMQSDLLATPTNPNDMMDYMYNGLVSSELTTSDVTSAYKVTFSVGYIVTYLVVGLGTVLVSALIPLMYILRLNPKKIMM
ncbi:ABC transporter permease [Enterococcus sp. JM4C]|uniref:ABC transporter permease n=1 Tax=Candidatus Enterococcus huntleyi TaxID=1857217 RepID=UPI00137A5170|nr:ABC transporter permease [Enterococcus sp. JM4C]KAF1296766.1 ABC transporter permease [Enterococcus sp. JM4C]